MNWNSELDSSIEEDKSNTRRRTYSCNFIKMETGVILLSNASDAYLDLVGICREDVGRSIDELYTMDDLEFIHFLFGKCSVSKKGSKLCRMKKLGKDHIPFKIAAMGDSSSMHCICCRLDSQQLHNQSDMVNQLQFHITGDYSKSLLFQKQADNSFIIESFSERLRDYWPQIHRDGVLSEEDSSYCIEELTELMNLCLDQKKAISYFDSLPFEQSLWCIALHPITHESEKRVFVILNNVMEDVQDFMCEEENPYSKTQFSNCVIRVCPTGMCYLAEMNKTFVQLMKRESFSVGDLMESKAIKECIEKRHFVLKQWRPKGGDKSIPGLLIFALPYTRDRTVEQIQVTLLPDIYLEDICAMTRLTERERQVCRLVAESRTNKYVATVLNISEGTVKKTLHNVYQKLGIGSRTELIKLMC